MNSTEAKVVESAPVDYDPFADAALSRVVPTTEPQREIWLADRLGREASLAYNESVSLRFSGALNTDALREALQDLVQRHEALRATIGADGEELCIASNTSLDVPVTDHSAFGGQEQAEAMASATQRAVETPFNIEHGPLFRAEILKLGAIDHLLIITAHHIVCDGWSFGVLINDLASLYVLRAGAPGKALDPPALFGDYALAQSASSGSAEHAADEAYWLSRFTGSIPTLELPTDRPRSTWRTFTSRREDYILDAGLVSEVRKAGSRNGASLFATLLGGFVALLQRIAASNDIVIGIPAAGQSVGGLEGLVGHCVNLLPLRIEVNTSAPVTDLIATTQAAILDALEHQRYTFGTLLTKLAIARDPSRLPLVSVMFNLDQALDANTAGFPDLQAEFSSNPRRYENFELFVNAVQIKGALRLECQYNADLFDGATIRKWLECYETLLRAACAAPDSTVGKLGVVSNEDQRLLASWNQTSRPFSRTALVHELIEAQASRVPENSAVTWQGTAISYSALDAQANRIAHCLRARGVRRGALVGIHIERGPEMIAAALAILKAGAAYVPLDPAYPDDRLAFMMDDAGLSVLLTESAPGSPLVWPRERCLFIDADKAEIDAQPESRLPRDDDSATPEDLAYVIYTSGSTGKPKGVQVPHRAIVNFLESMAREPGLSENDRLVAVTTLSFDIAVNELFLPLSVGAEIVLAGRDEAIDGATLGRLIEGSQATTMQATPATWRLLIEAGWRGNRQFKALCGGEALSADLAQQLLERTGSLWNMYGPTETTVWSTCSHVTGIGSSISIGRPIANTSVWIFDEQRQLCPIGVPGEIWIGGNGVTLGYLNRPDLTADKFIPDPLSESPGAWLYRTGDRGRWRADGLLEHLGRLDFQVKVRGYRIELGEIEVSLALHPDVARAVVIAREDRPGDVRLVAYLVAQPGTTLAEGTLKAHLKTILPDYMIPQHYVTLPAIPCLPNGKVDRKTLPAPHAPARSASDYVAPRTELEKAVMIEMEASLGLPGISVHDDFFELGGHSLLAAQLTSRLNRSLKINISMRTLFEAPTVARLAETIETQSVTGAITSRKPIEHLVDQNWMPASLMQERLWFLEKMYPGRVVYHAPSAHRLCGILDENAFEQAFREMMRRQSSLRTSFERDGHTVIQRIHDNVPIALFPAEDLSALAPDDRETKLLQRLDELTAETFDLNQAPLFKTRMFRLGDAEHVLFFMPHHIIWDGWSFDLVYDEISALYAAFSERRVSPLTDLPISYGDFSVWHREWIKGAEFGKQLAFWRERLPRIGKPALLPTDKPRKPGMSGVGATEWIVIDKPRTDALHELSMQSGTTLFVTLLAVYSVLLYDYARQTNLVIGTPVRGRNSLELEAIMGYFNNLLPLQLDINPAEPFIDLIKRAKATVIESFSCPDVPLEQLSRELPTVYGDGAPVLYQALFSFQDARQRTTQWGGLRHDVIPLFQRGATEDLGMWFLESRDGLHGGVTHNIDIFTSSTAQWMRERYLAILSAVIANPATTIAALAGPPKHVPANLSGQEALSPSENQKGSPNFPGPEFATGRSDYVAPLTDLEISLTTVWERVLGVPRVGITDSFFELGGNSLQAVNLILEMEDATGIEIDLDEVFRSPTIADIVRISKIRQSAGYICSDTPVLIRSGSGKNPLFFVHDGFGEVFLYRNLALRLNPEYPIYGLKPQALNGQFAHTRIVEMARAKVDLIRAIQPSGPYLLAGLCAGGVIAFEIARQLQDAGEQTAFVGIIDASDVAAEDRRFRHVRNSFKRVLGAFRRSPNQSLLMHILTVVPILAKKTANLVNYIISIRLEHAKNAKKIAALRGKATLSTSHFTEIDFDRLYNFAHEEHTPTGVFSGGDVVLFRATQDQGFDGDQPTRELCVDPLFGWQQRVQEPVKAIDVPGGHSSALQEPYVDLLAQEMQRCIDMALKPRESA